MTNSLLANLRWVSLPSENLGQDWFEKSLEIDTFIHQENMDLSEECTYLLFSEPPLNILDGSGQCLVARPVIGPKKDLSAPFKMIDWIALPVSRQALKGESLSDLLESAEVMRRKISDTHHKLSGPFMLCVRRSLKTELILAVEGVFHE